MPETKEYTPLSFCWNELATTDPAAAKTFYAGLFGWKANDLDMGPGGVYSMMQLNGKDVVGLYQLKDAQKAQGVPSSWLSYVLVEGLDAVAKKAEAVGGKVMAPPMQIADHGRMAVIIDPTGAALALWETTKRDSVKLVGDHGTVSWNELITKNSDQAASYYGRLFGWTAKAEQMGPMTYTVFNNGAKQAGGMLQITAEMGNMPSHWLTYFNVDDTDAAVAKALSLGGKVMAEPREIPGVGRFAVLQDPTGPAFGIIKGTSAM